MQKQFAIVDIETTGGSPGMDRVTEIAIALHDGEKIIDRFESLINPERSIPYNITQITGITNEMVADAPKFYEVAKQVVEMTQGAVFVAHNVGFDYSFIRYEFQQLGYVFRRRKLCTVRLSRKVFPGLRSYSLGNLIKHFKIEVTDRHRAMADVMATVELMEKAFAQDENNETDNLVNLGISETRLPKNITLDQLHELPEACGVYYFYNKEGDVIYVGKSVNIKKRAMQHFAAQTSKAVKMQQVIHDITYELTGSELIALLLEATEIKRISPQFNSALRNRNMNWCIHKYTNEAGYICFALAKTSLKKAKEFDIVTRFHRSAIAKSTLRGLVQRFELCACLCGIEESGKSCFQYQIGKCLGANMGEEDVLAYNEKAALAILAFDRIFEEDMLIIDKGRTAEEQSVVWIEDNQMVGFGYVEKEDLRSTEDLKNAVKSYAHHTDYLDIIYGFLRKGKKVKIVKPA